MVPYGSVPHQPVRAAVHSAGPQGSGGRAREPVLLGETGATGKRFRTSVTERRTELFNRSPASLKQGRLVVE